MADITKCSGEKGTEICKLRDSCYRYLAPENTKWQSYFCETPFDNPDNCIHYWEDKKKEAKK